MVCRKKNFHDSDEIAEKYTELIKAISGYIRFLKNVAKV